MRYTPHKVYVEPKQEKRLQKAIEKKGGTSIAISFDEPQNETLLFTKDQIHKIERARLMGKKIGIKMSASQVRANTEHHGGFLWALAARLAPALISGLASAAAAKVASKVLEKKRVEVSSCRKMDIVQKFNLLMGEGCTWHLIRDYIIMDMDFSKLMDRQLRGKAYSSEIIALLRTSLC